MAFLRGLPCIFNKWEQMGATGWAYRDVLPYFLQSEHNLDPQYFSSPYHNESGPIFVSNNEINSTLSTAKYTVNACRNLGFNLTDLNGPNTFGTNYNPQNIYRGARYSASKAYLEPIYPFPRRNLDILAYSEVTKILFSPDKRAIGVRVIRNGTTYTVRTRKEVVLSTGVIKSPQLLQLSGVGPQQLLNQFNITVVANLPGVGQNFKDHLYIYGLTLVSPRTGKI